jgi:hypothetical protein
MLCFRSRQNIFREFDFHRALKPGSALRLISLLPSGQPDTALHILTSANVAAMG